MTRPRLRLGHRVPALLLAATASCADAHAPASAQRVHGVISLPELSSLPLGLTAVARAGMPTTAVVRTYGSSTCDRPAGMDVAYSDRDVTLVPWVSARQAGTSCTDDLHAWNHDATLVFPTAGTARISAYGIVVGADGSRRLGTVSIDVSVQP